MTTINATSASFEQRINNIEKILANMKSQHQGVGHSGILLAGDPGVGKTSFIRFFANLLGLRLITIEAPHITEEHIINIPFFTFDPVTKREDHDSTKMDASNFKVVLADSNLYSKLKSIHKVPDSEYLHSIYAGPKDVIKIFEELGGDKDTIPDDIAEVRESTRVILFLDEYFRQTSAKIRNMLRGILNGKIGNHDLPRDAYVAYASNLNDDGVEGIPLNNDFHQVNFAAPNKDDWFSWLLAKFEQDEHVKLDMRVITRFHELLTDDKLNNDDFESAVRTSPRRWEQLLLYINSSIPVESHKDAKSLITNVKKNFRNYLTGEHSALMGEVLNAVSELINETSEIEVSATDSNGSDEWKDTLEHQIKQKMKLGDHRKYIPIISGMPGIGKTTHAIKIAKDLDLRYIYIDCSNLNPEDVVGLPLPKDGEGGKIETSFSEPNLYHQIMRDIQQADSDHRETLQQQLGGKAAADAISEYEKREWKYLIFFDELNRNSAKVFNGLRRLILEKSFGGGFDLPKGSVMIAAINPSDHGASELTSHMQDVVDVIDAAPNFEKTKEYLRRMNFKSLKSTHSSVVAFDALMSFIDKFKAVANGEIGTKQRNYFLDIGGQMIYVSPREYSDLFSSATINFDQKVNRLVLKKNITAYDKEQIARLEESLRTSLFEAFEDKLSNVFTKQGVNSPEFFSDLKNWFLNTNDFDIGNDIFFKKSKETIGLSKIIEPFFDDPQDDRHLSDDIDFIGVIENIEPQRFKEDLQEFLMEKFKDEKDIEEHIVAASKRGKVVNDKKIEFEEAVVSKFEHFVRELVAAFEIHNLSGEHREIIYGAVREVLTLVFKNFGSSHMMPITKLNSRVNKLVKGTYKK